MITRADCILLLTDLEERGIKDDDIMRDVLKSPEPSLKVIKYINDNRQLDLAKFYEKIRKSYNNKKSNLYINIVKGIENPSIVLTTLSAMLTQILLYSKDVENREMFLRHARALDISKILSNYFQTFDLTNCLKLIRIIKADIKALESIR